MELLKIEQVGSFKFEDVAAGEYFLALNKTPIQMIRARFSFPMLRDSVHPGPESSKRRYRFRGGRRL